MKHMRKRSRLLAIVLSFMMIFTVIPIGASAETPEGTAISSATEFAAMEADGNYYLTENIVISTTYASAFKGTLDGNGKTVSVTVPMFSSIVGGTVKNLTVGGNVGSSSASTSIGAVCVTASGNVTFENITNSTKVTTGAKGSSSGAGGIVGDIASTGESATITFKNCSNSGVITAKSGHGGGILGMSNVSDKSISIIIEGCTNTADIQATKPGGIVGYLASCTSKINNCHNTGNMVGTDCTGGIAAQIHENNIATSVSGCTNSGNIQGPIPGGIVGALLTKSDASAIELNINVSITDCSNSGTVTSTGTKYAGGIVGWMKNGGVAERLYNTGAVVANNYGAGIIGNSGSAVTRIAYCYNTADITATYVAAGIGGCVNNAAAEVYGCWNVGKVIPGATLISDSEGIYCGQITFGYSGQLYDNFYAADVIAPSVAAGLDDGAVITPYCRKNGTEVENSATDTKMDEDDKPTATFVAADLASGKLAYEINNALGTSAYFQKLVGADKDATPVLDAAHGTVFAYGDGYMSLAVTTKDSASARIEDGVAGLQFTTTVDKEGYDALITAGVKADDITVGTLITADSYRQFAEELGGSFTMADLDLLLSDLSPAYLNAVCANGFFKNDTSSYYFHNSVANIKEENYGMDYCAIGYVKIGDEIIYSTEYAMRNVSKVTEAAYADRSDTYANEIAATSEHAIGDKVTYSPYTEAQLTIIKKYKV